MKPIAIELLDRAVQAMASAIEIYNKPGIPYRNESFTILAINGWELLIKAKWLHLNGHRKQSLYVYEYRQTKKGGKGSKKYIKRTRSRAPFTHDAAYLANQLVNRKQLDNVARLNLEAMLEFRDCATHFYNQSPDFGINLYEIGAASVKNFVNAAHEWFGRETTEFAQHLMPLSFVSLPSTAKGILLNREESNFLAFLEGIDEPNMDPASPYSVRVNVEVTFTKSKAKDAIPFQKKSDDPSALTVKLTEEDIREMYPWDYAFLTDACKSRYKDFKANQKYHDIRKHLESDEKFGRHRFLDPGNAKSPKKPFFHPNIIAELDKHYSKKIPAS